MSDSKRVITEPKEIRQDLMYSYAYLIKQGKAGGQFIYCLEDNKFYTYIKGYWEQLFDIDFIGKIQESIPKLTRENVARRKQIVDNFKMLGRKHLSTFNWSELLNMNNGMLNPYQGEIDEHLPDYYSTIRLPYNFDKDAQCPLWLKSLNEIMENDSLKVNILQEFFGYCLTRDVKHHKALLLLGESRSGKSTILQTLRNVTGSFNCSSVPLKYISNPQYTAMLINKLVNIDTDVSAKATEFEAEFKTITSGEPVSVNQKYVAAFDFVPYCKVVMAANIFPRITDHSSAFYKRLILIPCDKVFSYEEQNRDLPKQLLNELPGILNWAIEGLKRLSKRGKFEELDFMKNAIIELENENNPTNFFFDEHIEVLMNEGTYIEKGELYSKYQIWCKETNNFILSKARFASAVFKKFGSFTPKDTKDMATHRRIWRNLKYVNSKEIKQDAGWQDDKN